MPAILIADRPLAATVFATSDNAAIWPISVFACRIALDPFFPIHLSSRSKPSCCLPIPDLRPPTSDFGPAHVLILDRYLLRQFLQTFAYCFISLAGLYIVIDAFNKLDKFNKVTAEHGNLFL